MTPTIDYAYYTGTYGGQMGETAFLEGLRPACDHVRHFCHHIEPVGDDVEAYKRALCACAEAYGEHGDGSGFAVGDFTWRPTPYAERGGTAVELANRACLEILGGTALVFCGIR